MLDIIFICFRVRLVIDPLLNQTLSVSFFTRFILAEFVNLPVTKADTMRYLCTELILGSFGNLPVIKADTLC